MTPSRVCGALNLKLEFGIRGELTGSQPASAHAPMNPRSKSTLLALDSFFSSNKLK